VRDSINRKSMFLCEGRGVRSTRKPVKGMERGHEKQGAVVKMRNCEDCIYDPRNNEAPGWVLCTHPESVNDEFWNDGSGCCKGWKGR